jgi:prophage regulatory protein
MMARMAKRPPYESPADRVPRPLGTVTVFPEGQLDLLNDWALSPVDQAVETLPNLESIASGASANAKTDDASAKDALLPSPLSEPIATNEKPAAKLEQRERKERPKPEGAASVNEAPGKAPRTKLQRKSARLGAKPVQSAVKLRQRGGPDARSYAPVEPPVFLSVESVAHRYDVSVATIWRAVADGSFPQPRKIIRNASRWAVADLDAHDRAKVQP